MIYICTFNDDKNQIYTSFVNFQTKKLNSKKQTNNTLTDTLSPTMRRLNDSSPFIYIIDATHTHMAIHGMGCVCVFVDIAIDPSMRVGEWERWLYRACTGCFDCTWRPRRELSSAWPPRRLSPVYVCVRAAFFLCVYVCDVFLLLCVALLCPGWHTQIPASCYIIQRRVTR